MYDLTFLNLQITRSDIKVGCQPGDYKYGHFNLPQGVYAGTYVLTLKVLNF